MKTIKKNLKLTSLLLSFLITGSSFAMDHKIADITNDEDRETTRFVLNTDDANEEITGFTMITLDEHGAIIKTRLKDVEGVYTRTGVVVEERDGRIIAAFKSDNFATHNGGNFTVDTLYNGISGKRKQYDFELVRAGSHWELLKNGDAVKNLHLKSKTVPLVGTVGISNIVSK
ncbi:MAG: hypothetical protein KC493_12715 [Bacteriovoracaceae bacterium]|nr:hypothetical protein [Bacteriovoracaceae bacterium]